MKIILTFVYISILFVSCKKQDPQPIVNNYTTNYNQFGKLRFYVVGPKTTCSVVITLNIPTVNSSNYLTKKYQYQFPDYKGNGYTESVDLPVGYYYVNRLVTTNSLSYSIDEFVLVSSGALKTDSTNLSNL